MKQRRRVTKTEPSILVKSWITIILSASAFALSAATAYFSLFRQDENISIVFREPPLLMREDENTLTVQFWHDPGIILINNGNRAAIINEVGLSVFEYKNEDGKDCDYGVAVASVYFSMELEPTVAKEKEVVFKKMSIRSASRTIQTKVQKLSALKYKSPLGDESRGKERVPFEICLRVNFSTPSYASYHVVIPLKRLDVERGWVDIGSFDPEPPRPHLLLRKVGTIFGSY